ncbi:Hpt domain-containing protein [Edaphobacter flagellatus]|uniref:Hpt domain-containing protein n=1 Tax=Edaphobacter flagellatus TaxID=1933044 RepID=UPI0021B3A9CF|nr:Hpt domain-containing protein [Edaphobacter flagellatus]
MNVKQADTEINALLADLWKRHLPSMHERLKTLDRAALLAAAGRLAENERAEALSTAHKLAGNLGMFGYKLAGSVASEMEHILKEPTPETLGHLAALARRLRHTLAPHLG